MSAVCCRKGGQRKQEVERRGKMMRCGKGEHRFCEDSLRWRSVDLADELLVCSVRSCCRSLCYGGGGFLENETQMQLRE